MSMTWCHYLFYIRVPAGALGVPWGMKSGEDGPQKSFPWALTMQQLSATLSYWHCMVLLQLNLALYYLGNKYSNKIWITPFMMCKSTKYVWLWVLIFGLAFLSLNYWIKGYWGDVGPDLVSHFFSPTDILKNTPRLHLITASEILELEHCSWTQIEDLE